jgi:outer membrane protein assembly factor BamB
VTGAWRSFKGTPDRCSFTEESLVFPLRRAWTFADAGAPAAISPVVYGGIVFIATTGGGLYALNQYNGSLVWSKPLESPLISSPVVDADVIYQATSSGKVYCLDREKGRLNWVFPATKRGIGSVHASLLLADDSLIAVTMKGKIFCLDRKTGKSRWLTPVRAGESLGEVTAGPAASEARLVVAARDGYVLCCSLDDGRVLWRFPEEPLATKILSTPAICHGMVYFAERGGKCYALDLATGGDRWDLATQLAGIVEGSPAVAGERVFIGTWDSLFCLDRFAGGILWKARNENLPSLDSINTTPVVTASGQVLYGGDSGYFYARTSSGEEIWKYRFDEPFVGNPVVSDGFLYTITRSGVLTALRSAT